MEALQVAIGIGFAHSPVQAWTLEAASGLQIRDFLKRHEGLAILSYIAWTTYFNYWSHRLFHKFGALWELHKVHHSATRMTGFSVYRVHPFEDVIGTYVAPILITLLLPESGPRFALYFGFISTVHNVAVHSEWKASWGWVSWVFTSPLAHQIHHSTNPKHYNANFGVPLVIWDRLHGTYVDPLKSEAPTRFGVEGIEPASPRMLIVDPMVRFARALLPASWRSPEPAIKDS